MIPDFLKNVLEADYWTLLANASASGDYTPLIQRLDGLKTTDHLMLPYGGEPRTKYYKSFAQTIVPKILPALQEAIAQQKPPEIHISYEEIEATRARLGLPDFGSPQDVLYGFTSERYAHWGQTITGMGFRSACMSKPTRAVVTMAPRYLSMNAPEVEVQELPGAISVEFHETNQAVFGKMPFQLRYQLFCKECNISCLSETDKTDTALKNIFSQLQGLQNGQPNRIEINRQILLLEIEEFIGGAPDAAKTRRFLTAKKRTAAKVSQEQLVLKYVTEGNYLQKLLGGHRVEHIQSNVKMVPNVLRGYKCEVDAIYRVVGQERILLLEAKGKDKISRAQLYGVYETFRSKLPISWNLDIVAAMLTNPTETQRQSGAKQCIDLVQIGLSDHLPETFTERLMQVSPKKHYRWLIR